MRIDLPQDVDLDENHYELHCIYLHPYYLRQGIGTKAIMSAFDTVRELEKGF
ncbi:MAG: GNAT family N-acetyltransferase [Clostridiales bacterium]|nr:GNAT family N-acetyltransferase [Clostridiales bacterium]